MEFFRMPFIEITLNSLGAITFLFVLAKLTGPRQISQLTFYDYVVGISIGSIASAIAIDSELEFWLGLWAMAIFAGTSILIAILGNKSIHVRRIFSGVPSILIYRGEIMEKTMRKKHFDINELLMTCRSHGYFDIDDLEYVIMEPNGQLSFLPKSEKAPLTPSDMNLQPSYATLQANVIIDGHIMHQHLRNIGQNEGWLKQRLKEQGISDLNQVLLATADEKGNFHVYRTQQDNPHTNLFE